MKVIDVQQRSAEWHAWRKGGVSATSCAVIMDQNPDKTKLQLWRELVGLDTPPDLACIPQVRRGVKFEPVALQAFEERYGQLGLPICAESSDYPFMRASFDGLLAGNEPVEIKNLSDDNHLEVLALREKSKAYRLYRWQLLHQMIVSGASRGYLWCWSPKHEPICLVVDLNEAVAQQIIAAERRFWDMVESLTPPEADPKRDLMPHAKIDHDRWSTLAAVRRDKENAALAAKKALEELQNEITVIDDQILALMGDFKRADAYGVRVIQYEVQGRVNWKAVAESVCAAIPADVVEYHRADSRTATRISVDAEFDETTYKPEVMPQPRMAKGPVDTQALLSAGVFTF
ncbi:DNA recombination protein [Stutzerimonas xanthomarina]|jgi:putative phage-type endonuclease|uniref:DNA recombination protein n=2 Tax=Stutzerimonas TaxID=2901164 RepID=A0A165T0M9_STUST|nr:MULTISPECIES: YqaJ viral recombinase family protein [Stutzerimonas]MCH2339064.1 YqaJ viral recombinase family protein [Pseudomonas sp.]WAD28966.1 YqaJ viral recombinase family protein [Pseudomonadaceae bacterium T75]KZX56679.1 DNA recombination protein [Stutzerimonas frequens]MBH3355798.1 YqaJ viral recombinase family protein [Stutzerimonas stutzeri]MDH0084102.1 YqaJ viral recombinase family protein [Stutzerimonas stutzeri]